MKKTPELDRIRREQAEHEDRAAHAMKLDGPREPGHEGFEGEGAPDLVPVFFPDRKYLGEHGYIDRRVPINAMWVDRRLGKEPENTQRFHAAILYHFDYQASLGVAAGSGHMIYVDKSPAKDGGINAQIDAAARHAKAQHCLPAEFREVLKWVVLAGERPAAVGKRLGVHHYQVTRRLIKGLDRLVKHYGRRARRLPPFSLSR